MPEIQVFAGHSTTDPRNPSIVVHEVEHREVHETLRKIGLEYKTSDYFHHRQVVIVIDPDYTDPRDQRIERLRRALIAAGVNEGLVDAIESGEA